MKVYESPPQFHCPTLPCLPWTSHRFEWKIVSELPWCRRNCGVASDAPGRKQIAPVDFLI